MGDHTESIQIDYDPKKISYKELLTIFWRAHSPELKAYSQQYKAAIFYHDETQHKLALETKAALEKIKPVYTELIKASTFTRAEDYHQKYQMRRYEGIMADFKRMYPNPKDFADSTAAARINGFLMGYGRADDLKRWLPQLGLGAHAQKELLSYTKHRLKE